MQTQQQNKNKLKIGSVTLDNILIMAPLAGITNLPFRLMVKHAGTALVCSEMISSNGIVYKSKNTIPLLDTIESEKPLSVQIFGSDPAIMSEATKFIETQKPESRPDIIDINFGCSVKKILKSGSGAALMKDEKKAEAVILAVRKATELPVTIKIRTGWDSSGDQALKIAEIAENCGVNAIAIHPRTVKQAFRGEADWSIIKKLKDNISIPVIGNGDIRTPEDAILMKEQTNCDGIMIGRSAIGFPWIFTQTLDLLENREKTIITKNMRFNLMKDYIKESVTYLGEKTACYMLRSRLCWFVKGLSSNKIFKESIKHIESRQEALQKVLDYEHVLASYEN